MARLSPSCPTAIKPDYAYAYNSMGVAYDSLKQYPDAIAAFKKYLDLDPTGEYADQARKKISELSNRDARTKPHVASVLREPTTQPAGILPEGRSEKWIFVDGKWIKVVAATQRADK